MCIRDRIYTDEGYTGVGEATNWPGSPIVYEAAKHIGLSLIHIFPLYSSPPPIVSGSNILVSEVPVHKFSPDTNMRNLDTANFLVRDTGRVYPN